MIESAFWTIVEISVAAFLLILGWFALFRTSSLQRRYAAPYERSHERTPYHSWMIELITSRANARNIRFGGVVAIFFAAVIIYFRIL